MNSFSASVQSTASEVHRKLLFGNCPAVQALKLQGQLMSLPLMPEVDLVNHDNADALAGSADSVQTDLSKLLRKDYQSVVGFGKFKGSLVGSRRNLISATSESRSPKYLQGV